MTHNSTSPLLRPDDLPTVGQLERQLSQAMQSSYSKWTGHSPRCVLCHVVGPIINVLLQDSITPLEGFLCDAQPDLIRAGIHEKMRCLIAEIATEICGVSTQSVMLDSSVDSGLTGIIIVLTASPKVRTRRRRHVT